MYDRVLLGVGDIGNVAAHLDQLAQGFLLPVGVVVAHGRGALGDEEELLLVAAHAHDVAGALERKVEVVQRGHLHAHVEHAVHRELIGHGSVQLTEQATGGRLF